MARAPGGRPGGCIDFRLMQLLEQLQEDVSALEFGDDDRPTDLVKRELRAYKQQTFQTAGHDKFHEKTQQAQSGQQDQLELRLLSSLGSLGNWNLSAALSMVDGSFWTDFQYSEAKSNASGRFVECWTLWLASSGRVTTLHRFVNMAEVLVAIFNHLQAVHPVEFWGLKKTWGITDLIKHVEHLLR